MTAFVRLPFSCPAAPGVLAILAIFVVSSGSGNVFAADEPKAATKVDYLTEIKPLLASRCYACHGALQKKAGLRIDTVELMRQGGDGGDILDPEGPILIDRLTDEDPAQRMPPEGEGAPLTADQIGKIRAWIEAGAPAPESETPEASPKDHWAFQPVKRPEVPAVKNRAWVRNPIDAFVLARLEKAGLEPAPPADSRTQLRRLYLDLVGLPPGQAEIDKWRTSPDEAEYRRIVTKLLDDPAHGERWGRHWMDIWRYSDWWGLGAQLRNSQKNIWHWRDWIVESLNADMPYDRMVRLSLAADEIEPENLKDLRATGYLARNYFLFNRNQWMDETVEHVSKAFLGLTVNCAKCHDHKFDPVSQAEYYGMRAIFEPYMVRNDLAPGGREIEADGIPRAYDARPADSTWLFVRGDDKNPDKSRPIAPGVPEFLGGSRYVARQVPLPEPAWKPGLRSHARSAQMAAARQKLASSAAAYAEADKAWAAMNAAPEKPKPSDGGEQTKNAQPTADAKLLSLLNRTLAEKNWRAAQEWAAAVQARVDADLAGADRLPEDRVRTASKLAALAERRHTLAAAEAEVARLELEAAKADDKTRPNVTKTLETAKTNREKARDAAFAAGAEPPSHTPIPGAEHARTMFLSSTAFDADPAFPNFSTGRRKALADWIVDRENPLAARVAVNHLWSRHFGQPLVASVFDFGRKGQPPTHPELLDWLAAELMDSGWSMKHMHRLIVDSATYRMSSSIRGREANQSVDPDNRLLWRRMPVRVESQVVRDMILDLAGTLDRTMGGPPVPPEAQEASKRRSLYFFHSNNDRNSFLTTFDEALVRDCYRRDTSIVPQQALALSNARLVAESTEPIARRIEREVAAAKPGPVSDEDFVRQAFVRVLAFEPSAEEMSACLETMRSWAKRHPGEAGGKIARDRMVWALINHNDFVTLR